MTARTASSAPIHPCAVALGVALALCSTQASAQVHDTVSAAAAHDALARGATVLDVRAASAFAAGHLPGAVSLPHLTARAASALSKAGVDLSREVVLVTPADTQADALQAHALHQQLRAVASGRVLWLVGGTPEWAQSGRALSTQASAAQRLPVPQHLVSFVSASADNAPQAGAQRRQVQAQWTQAATAVRLY